MKKLNLGCGTDIQNPEIWVNHDIREHCPEVVITHDLNIIPWPWQDNQFSEILAKSVFEHLENDLVTTMNECWRILCSGGILRLKVPVYTSPFIHDDPTHRWFWSEKSLDFFDPTTKYGKECDYYTDRHWKILKKHLGEKKRNLWAVMMPDKS